MSMTLEEFKRSFGDYIKGTADADIETNAQKGLEERFPDLDPSNKPSLKMLADVLHEAALGLAAKLPTLLKPLTEEATRLNTALPTSDKADLKLLSDAGWLAKTAYTVVEAMQSDWLNHTQLGTFQEVILERPGKAAEWCDSFKAWVEEQDKLAGQIASQITDREFVEPLRQKSKAVPVAKASTIARPRAPITQAAARDVLANVDPTEPEDVLLDGTANLLDDMRKYLVQNKGLVKLNSRAELAEAMAREQNTTVEIALGTINNNKGRGFTAPNGTVYVANILPSEMVEGETAEDIANTGDHDEVHETVHLMSAPGGATKILSEQGEQCNEGFTEYFAKQMCAKLGVADANAYADHVAFVRKLVPIVGFQSVYAAYMKNGGLDPIIDKLTDIWIGKNVALMATMKTKAHAPPKTKGTTVVDRTLARENMNNRFKNNFPPTGAMLNFWNAVFFG